VGRQSGYRVVRSPAIGRTANRSFQESTRTKVQQALKSRTEVDFTQVPLDRAIEYLKDLHDIEIQFDKWSLAEVGLSPSFPITYQVKGISLGSALKLILREFDLTYVAEDEYVLITTAEKARTHLKTKVYYVPSAVRTTIGFRAYGF
jgi:hypothetical protein